ncbi:MAG: radical SAM protein [Candidatus Bathyarchaeia archaeon]|jgi:radical SAM protein with 4Fe4S-binding SPASM domain|nr:radical SAM protein [Candidatus Bathyarchaeota archaeon A05DMB-4]MDH7595400.1 radical SAM protein [Candidatus Bathyarchaeota archaeon]
MNRESLENIVLSSTLNPVLRALIARFDVDCGLDGSLLLNSLKDFLGGNVDLCENCSRLSRNIAKPFYNLGMRAFRIKKDFLQRQFLSAEYSEAWLKGFGLMMKGIRKYGVRVPFTPAGPFEIVWNFTYTCNLRCKHCYEDAGKKRPELSTEQALEVIDVLSRTAGVGLPALSFSGGEPLMRKDFFEVAAYAKKKIPYISIATNGTLLSKDNVERLKDVGVDYVEVSLDGATAKVHEEFRQVLGCFEKTMQGIRNSLDAGLDTCIATTVQRLNLDEVEKVVSIAEELGVRFMHFNYIPTGRAKSFVELDLTPDERLRVLELLGRKIFDLYLRAKEEEQRFGKSSVVVDRFFSTCPQYASVVKRIVKEHGERFAVSAHYATKRGVENVANFLGGCGGGRLYMCLEPNGDMKPCVFFATGKHTVLGNILKDNFERVWDTHPFLWKMRSRENLETYNVGGRIVGCGNCKDKYICGGCRARAFSYFNGDVDAPDVGCIDNEALWEKIVKSVT